MLMYITTTISTTTFAHTYPPRYVQSIQKLVEWLGNIANI